MDAVDVCRQIYIEDAIRDAEYDGGIAKIRKQVIVQDGKMYTESNSDATVELDPMESGWGLDASPFPMEGEVGPLN